MRIALIKIADRIGVASAAVLFVRDYYGIGVLVLAAVAFLVTLEDKSAAR